MDAVGADSGKEVSTGAIDANISDDERFSTLAPYELSSVRRQPWLRSRGYMLRPRYRPGWVPLWRTTDARPVDCEDSVQIGVCDDAKPIGVGSSAEALLGIPARHRCDSHVRRDAGHHQMCPYWWLGNADRDAVRHVASERGPNLPLCAYP